MFHFAIYRIFSQGYFLRDTFDDPGDMLDDTRRISQHIVTLKVSSAFK